MTVVRSGRGEDRLGHVREVESAMSKGMGLEDIKKNVKLEKYKSWVNYDVLHEYAPEDGVRSKALPMLRFMYAEVGAVPAGMSLSNAVAQFDVLLGRPLEVLHGENGPGLACLYHP